MVAGQASVCLATMPYFTGRFADTWPLTARFCHPSLLGRWATTIARTQFLFVLLRYFSPLVAGRPLRPSEILSFAQNHLKVSPNGVLDLTNPDVVSTLGRVLYKTPVTLWDTATDPLIPLATGKVASFVTTFSFTMTDIETRQPADGFMFFLAPSTDFPSNAIGGSLGIVDNDKAYNEFVGVEFDPYENEWDPNYSHVGIEVSSLRSLKYTKWNRVSSLLVDVTITYDSQLKTLSVVLKDGNGQFSTVAQVVDFKYALPETVWIGFSSAWGE
ncbi:hypothetical protein TSUD_413060 [Trifolium subterraneum]|uniref:Legume lectin domain-containing protein n=1 Tax=Trifolium subterraneum TaxID=3900 RepID=A0A2Z6P4L0_TRISU|nr:hypothetical protein TSUD_413060 [Trifolium subterraneum]